MTDALWRYFGIWIVVLFITIMVKAVLGFLSTTYEFPKASMSIWLNVGYYSVSRIFYYEVYVFVLYVSFVGLISLFDHAVYYQFITHPWFVTKWLAVLYLVVCLLLPVVLSGRSPFADISLLLEGKRYYDMWLTDEELQIVTEALGRVSKPIGEE